LLLKVKKVMGHGIPITKGCGRLTYFLCPSHGISLAQTDALE
jgi:hypothetical protein